MTILSVVKIIKPYKQNIVINLEPDLQEKLYLYSELRDEDISDSINRAIRNLVDK